MGATEVRHTRGNVYRNPAHVVLSQLNFASVHTYAHGNVQPTQRGTNGIGAMDCPGRTVKGRQKAIAKRLHLTAPEARKFLAHHLVVSFEKVSPGEVALSF